ncbi:hypothetical protein OH686_19435 [Pseudomonas sp. SO81]|nr:hypothetical protein OH686_19435 [Pseudomonas sp. SO81]
MAASKLKLRLRVRIAWWWPFYVMGVRVACSVTGLPADPRKVLFWANRAVKGRVSVAREE